MKYGCLSPKPWNLVQEKRGLRLMFLHIPDLGRPTVKITLASVEHCLFVKVVVSKLYSIVFHIVVCIAVKTSDLEREHRAIVSAHEAHLDLRCKKCEFICPEGENMIPRARAAAVGASRCMRSRMPSSLMRDRCPGNSRGVPRVHLFFSHLCISAVQ